MRPFSLFWIDMREKEMKKLPGQTDFIGKTGWTKITEMAYQTSKRQSYMAPKGRG